MTLTEKQMAARERGKLERMQRQLSDLGDDLHTMRADCNRLAEERTNGWQDADVAARLEDIAFWEEREQVLRREIKLQRGNVAVAEARAAERARLIASGLIQRRSRRVPQELSLAAQKRMGGRNGRAVRAKRTQAQQALAEQGA